jgi:hypothetical protein
MLDLAARSVNDNLLLLNRTFKHACLFHLLTPNFPSFHPENMIPFSGTDAEKELNLGPKPTPSNNNHGLVSESFRIQSNFHFLHRPNHSFWQFLDLPQSTHQRSTPHRLIPDPYRARLNPCLVSTYTSIRNIISNMAPTTSQL